MKVISFSLWGTHPMYRTGALENLELATRIYPDWECWFYVDQAIHEEVRPSLESAGGKVIAVERKHQNDGMFWRFAAATHEEVSVMISRDTDSRLSEREKSAVDQWLSSDKSFHIMRDHPYHFVKILGGMWGVRHGVLRELQTLIQGWQHFERKGCDQDFLGQVIYPKIRHDAMIHDEIFKYEGERPRPFPKARADFEFVGDVFDEHNNRNPEFKQLLMQHLLHQQLFS